MPGARLEFNLRLPRSLPARPPAPLARLPPSSHRELRQKKLTRVELRKALMPLQPRFHPGVLVGGVVVEHHVNRFVGRHFAFDGIEKADEFLMPVTLIQRPMTLPSRISRAANRVVVPLRLYRAARTPGNERGSILNNCR
jgi:hypothetical protein